MPKKKKAKGMPCVWKGTRKLRVLLADGSTAVVDPDEPFDADPDWVVRVCDRQPDKQKNLHTEASG